MPKRAVESYQGPSGEAATWEPRSDAQRQALACQAEIMLFGGAAGSLKSETMLMDAVRERDNGHLNALLLRRTYPELEMGLIRRSRELMPGFGAVYNEQRRLWTFPSGARLAFGYCESDKDIYRYQGAEFSFIGIDESTHFSELPIRYLLSRLRSTDSTLKLRVRLATNPGNIGHNTHKHIFLGATCTHCHATSASRQPGVIYRDAVWPSDQHPIGKSTCFIPGRLTDHTLLGSGYADSLESLPGTFRKALLEGCWDVHEGQYFINWNRATMTVPRASIGHHPDWHHWVGIDYGFAESQAVAYLLCQEPPSEEARSGRIYVLEEYAAKHQLAADFAHEVKRRFAVDGRRIIAWYLSPDAWNQRGDGMAIAAQMSQAANVEFTRAENDRCGGAMWVYFLLEKGQLLIADTCRQLIEAIPSRIHDPERSDDIRKVSGDPLDDCIDALRYAVYTHGRARPPASVSASAPNLSRDPTVAAIQHRMAEARLRESQTAHRGLGSRSGGSFSRFHP